jgi:hypothetical protein
MSVHLVGNTAKIIKPKLWHVSSGIVHPSFRWAWRGVFFFITYMEGGDVPCMQEYGDVNRDVITTSGTPVWDTGVAGLGMHYKRANSAAHHISNANLPANFPGKTATDVPFTIAAVIQETIPAGAGDSGNFLQKDSSTGTPYFFWLEDDGYVRSYLTGTVASSNPYTISANKVHVIISRYDGTNADTAVDGMFGTPIVTTTASNSGPLNIATRTNAYGGTTRSWNGILYAIYAWDWWVPNEQLIQLSLDPFGPIRANRYPTAFKPGVAPPAGGEEYNRALMHLLNYGNLRGNALFR